MICNTEIHDELINIGESMCPYCFELLMKGDTSPDLCCGTQQIENLNGIGTCISCGQVDNYTTENEFIDYSVNIYKIKKKSIYCRYYHVENVINKLCLDDKIKLTIYQRLAIYKIFDLIDTIIPKVNNTGRKRLISINYILRMIFKMMKLSYDNIPISKSKRTLAFYEKYWNSVMSLIGTRIHSIIDKKPAYILNIKSI